MRQEIDRSTGEAVYALFREQPDGSLTIRTECILEVVQWLTVELIGCQKTRNALGIAVRAKDRHINADIRMELDHAMSAIRRLITRVGDKIESFQWREASDLALPYAETVEQRLIQTIRMINDE